MAAECKTKEKILDTLRAVLEETAIRIVELKKDAYEFKRDIVVGGENMRTGKTMAEKLTRYMEDKLRQRDSLVEKLRLKNATMKTQLHKVDAQLRQKDEMGDVLHYIDFHQLQIENKQFISNIEDRNGELLRLKSTSGHSVQHLTLSRTSLIDMQLESEWLQAEIHQRTEQLRALQHDLHTTRCDASAESNVQTCLQVQAETNDVPSTYDYVHLLVSCHRSSSAESYVEINDHVLRQLGIVAQSICYVEALGTQDRSHLHDIKELSS